MSATRHDVDVNTNNDGGRDCDNDDCQNGISSHSHIFFYGSVRGVVMSSVPIAFF